MVGGSILCAACIEEQRTTVVEYKHTMVGGPILCAACVEELQEQRTTVVEYTETHHGRWFNTVCSMCRGAAGAEDNCCRIQTHFLFVCFITGPANAS